MYMYMYNMHEDPKNCQKSNQNNTKKAPKIIDFVAKLPKFFKKISAIFPRKFFYVIWWPYIPNMVPTFATCVAPKVSEFDSGGADHLKFDIRIHHLRVIVWHQLGTNLGTRNQMVPGLYWAY